MNQGLSCIPDRTSSLKFVPETPGQASFSQALWSPEFGLRRFGPSYWDFSAA